MSQNTLAFSEPVSSKRGVWKEEYSSKGDHKCGNTFDYEEPSYLLLVDVKECMV